MNHSTPTPSVVYVGVDVGIKILQLHGLSRRKQLSNIKEDHASFIHQLPPNAHVIMESSGGYEKPLWLALLRAGCKVSRVNARHVRCLAGTKGQWAKNDACDAALLAEFGATRQPKPDKLPSDILLELEDLVARREQLVTLRARNDVQTQQLSRPCLMEQSHALLAFLNTQIRELDTRIAQCLKHEEMAQKAKRLQQVRGVGPGLCATLLATMPELGTLGDNQAAALIGVAPYDDDSGNHRGARHIRGGRARPRCVLYMAALSASRHNPILRAFYQRKINEGKPHKVVLTAVMRKLIILLNRLIKEPHFTLAT
jgi:transposase